VDMDTDYGDSRFMGMAAEHESESDGYAYAYTKGHNDGINDEVIYRPSIATDREKNIYRKILKQKAETYEQRQLRGRKERTDLVACGGYCGQKYPFNELQMMRGDPNDNWCKPCGEKLFYQLKGADTVGSPSPSGPSSTPEPAEATGSEPSNENMEAEGSNMKMALGILGVGVGAVALLGGDRIKKIFEKLGL